ncbi:hypothetical protein KC315_g19254, partial [Hortaea werneckii]
NRQGPDVGSQYRSGIFYNNDEQKSVAEEVTKKANEQWWKGGIVTEILPAGKWWDAEKYHQLYLDNNPGGYECPSHYVRKLPDLQEFSTSNTVSKPTAQDLESAGVPQLLHVRSTETTEWRLNDALNTTDLAALDLSGQLEEALFDNLLQQQSTAP